MPFLIIQEKSQPDRTYHIAEDQLIIGRGEQTDLVFPNVSVSRVHSKIFFDAKGWNIQDMGSQNGTLVNNEKIKTSKLVNGDKIVLGKYSLIFVGDENMGLWQGTDLAEYPIFGGQAPLEHDSTFTMSSAMIQKMLETNRKRQLAFISHNSGEDRTTIGDQTLVIGGTKGLQLKGLLSFVTAATITWDGRDHVVHKQRLIKVRVNGNAVKSKRLRQGDTITVGTATMKYEIHDS